jgi:prepilin-type N-terminal cleavage/methylation domain-containing protein
MKTKDEGGRMKDESDHGRRAVAVARRGRRRGVGLVELLVALAISAALLTATAVAIDASFKSYAVNQEQSDLTQRSRLAMYRMVSVIRQTQLHQPVTGTTAYNEFKVGKTVTASGIETFDLAGKPIRYFHDAVNKRLMVRTQTGDHVMCEGVEAFAVTMVPMRSAQSIRTGGNWDLLKRATLLLSVRTTGDTAVKGEGVGEQVVTLSASVMPRRNTW